MLNVKVNKARRQRSLSPGRRPDPPRDRRRRGKARRATPTGTRTSPPSSASTPTPCCARCGCFRTRGYSSFGAAAESRLPGHPSAAPSSRKCGSWSSSPARRDTPRRARRHDRGRCLTAAHAVVQETFPHTQAPRRGGDQIIYCLGRGTLGHQDRDGLGEAVDLNGADPVNRAQATAAHRQDAHPRRSSWRGHHESSRVTAPPTAPYNQSILSVLQSNLRRALTAFIGKPSPHWSNASDER